LVIINYLTLATALDEIGGNLYSVTFYFRFVVFADDAFACAEFI